jgi:hypothetical protein
MASCSALSDEEKAGSLAKLNHHCIKLAKRSVDIHSGDSFVLFSLANHIN